MRSALSFLTVLGGARRPGPRTLDWFPLVGAALGLTLGGVWWLAGRAWPVGVAAAVLVVADLAVTGLLHIDGLIDSADGLLPPLDPNRRLEVMRAPEAGAFGVAATIAVLLLRWAAAASLKPAILLVAGLWCLSRTFAAVIARTRPYAGGGLAEAFDGPHHWVVSVAGLAAGTAALMLWNTGPGAAAAASAAVITVLVQVLAERRVGGYTGDTLGAAIILSETAGLLTAAARWCTPER